MHYGQCVAASVAQLGLRCQTGQAACAQHGGRKDVNFAKLLEIKYTAS